MHVVPVLHDMINNYISLASYMLRRQQSVLTSTMALVVISKDWHKKYLASYD